MLDLLKTFIGWRQTGTSTNPTTYEQLLIIIGGFLLCMFMYYLFDNISHIIKGLSERRKL